MALFSNNNGIFSPSGKQIIPSVTSADAGKVLSVDNNGDWGAATAPVPLPEVTSADAGKVLTVDEQGAWGAAEASGGGNFVLKKLGEVTYSTSPHDVGWKASQITFNKALPDDFAFLGPVCFPGRAVTSEPLTYVQTYQTVNQFGIHINGILHVYYSAASQGIAGATLEFYYYAKS